MMNKPREILFWISTDSWEKNITVSVRVDFDKFIFEDIKDCFESGMVISKIIYHRFGYVSITRLKRMAIKRLMEGLPENLPDLE